MSASTSENPAPEDELVNAAEVDEQTADDAASEAEGAEAESVEPELSLEDQLAQAERKANENWDLYLRAKAEEDNARRRAEQEVVKARKFALEKFTSDLLNVVDNFEMGLAASTQENASLESIREGNDLTLKQLVQVLERFGVKNIEAQGQKFDPQLHEAISMQPSAEHEPNTVMMVVQKGYSLNDRLLRPARVIVSAKQPE